MVDSNFLRECTQIPFSRRFVFLEVLSNEQMIQKCLSVSFFCLDFLSVNHNSMTKALVDYILYPS